MPESLYQNTYPTGVDMEVFFEDATGDLIGPLDIKQITLVEEGSVLPIYNFFDYKTNRFLYSKRVVSGTMLFNASREMMEEMRVLSPQIEVANRQSRARDGFQRLQGVNLVVEMQKVQYQPRPKFIRDRLRIRQVWTHPIQHAPEPHAQENVKFTARDMVLYDRREAAIDAEAVGQFVVRPESFDIQSALRPVQRQQLARVLPGMGKDGGVVDADTFKVELVDDGTVEEIRLSTADAPETPKRDGYNGKTNETFRAFWAWPETAGRQGGEPGEAPTAEQLDQWGSYATKYVNERWLPEERLVWLVRDSGSAATGEYGRKLFQVYNLRGESLDEHLIQQGLAFPKSYPTEGRVNGQLQGRQKRLFRLFKEERANAGRPGASGVWKSFSPPSNL